MVILGRQGSGKGTQSLRIAEAYGCVHISTGDVLRAAMELAGRLAEKAPISLAYAKRLIGAASAMPRGKALKKESRALERIFGTRDWQEGVDAYHEKRPPEYTGE